MKAKKFAERLNGREYGNEMTEAEENEAKRSNLVVIFGASDDLMELRGAVDGEVDAYEGGIATIFNKELIERTEDTTECNECRYVKFFNSHAKAIEINAYWGDDNYAFTYDATVPFETFDILEDGEKYCRGIVLSLDVTTDDERGLYSKYTVINNETGIPSDTATFTLKPDKDRAAVIALKAYAEATDNEKLRADIMKWVREVEKADAK